MHTHPSIRVLHLIPSFAGGGAERQLAYTARTLSTLGVDVHVAHVHDGPNLPLLNDASVGLHRIRCAGNYDPAIFVNAVRLMRRLKPQIVHTWLLQMDVFGGMAARFLNIPWVLSERSSPKMYENGWKFRLRRALGSKATAIVANSDAGLSYWPEALQYSPSRVIRNALPVDDLLARTREPEMIEGIAADDPLIVFAGRYTPEKNLAVLLQALDPVLARFPATKVLFFGSGPLESDLIAIRSTLAMGSRIFIRPYSNHLAYWMHRAAAFVSISRYEGTPNTVIEAAVCGSPLVVSDISEHREILDSSAALFVPCDSVATIADALSATLGDPIAAACRAKVARSLFLEWSPDRIARQYIDLYQSILRNIPSWRAS
jgi:glycosyltransferase involved in cell wall biosynthesis